jgi:5'-nucleotidase
MAVILVDMDDVLAKFEQGFLERWRRCYPDLPFVPLDQRNVFYAEKQYPDEHREKVRRLIRAQGFFLGLEPVEGGLEALREMTAAGHEVFLCTAPISNSINCPKEKTEWVLNHLGVDYVKRLILAPDKTLVRGDFLIDDRPDADRAGLLTPVWEHVVFDCPYNRAVVGKRRLAAWRDWRAVLGL